MLAEPSRSPEQCLGNTELEIDYRLFLLFEIHSSIIIDVYLFLKEFNLLCSMQRVLDMKNNTLISVPQQ